METMLVLYLAGGLVASQPSTPAECRMMLATHALILEQDAQSTFMFELDGRDYEVVQLECVEAAAVAPAAQPLDVCEPEAGA